MGARGGGDPADVLPPGLGAGTLPAQIHDLLEQAIIDGTLEPGRRLHSDKLAARYGVSRIPVREALRSLHEAGWVDIRPRYGVYVRERSETELHELVEARSVIEATLARWAAERHGPADLRRLRTIVADSERAADRGGSGDAAALVRLGGEFYAAVRLAAGNAVLGRVSADLEKRARFYFSMVADQLGADWVSVHRNLVALVADRNGDGAAERAQLHILDTGRAVAELLESRAAGG